MTENVTPLEVVDAEPTLDEIQAEMKAKIVKQLKVAGVIVLSFAAGYVVRGFVETASDETYDLTEIPDQN